MRRGLAALLALAGCLSPSYSDQTHCGPKGECPSGRSCSLAGDPAGFCLLSNPADAAVSDGGDGGAGANLSILPGLHDFGTVVTGMTSTVTFHVSNGGAGTSGALAATLTGSGSAAFRLGAGTCANATLAPGAGCTQDVSFAPTSAGPASASIVVTGAPGELAQANLAATGAVPGSLAVDKTTDDFGSVELGADSTDHTFTITNNGGSSSGILSVMLGGSGAGDFAATGGSCAGASVAAGANCTVVAHFHPAMAGARSASLSVSGTGGTAVTTLTGTGLAHAALAFDATTEDFGSVGQGMTSTATVHLMNTGGVKTGALTTTITGTDAALFSATSDSCRTTLLDPGASCAVVLAFTPTSAGVRSGSLQIQAGGASATLPLTGTGLAPGALTITPMAAIGTLSVGSSATATLTVTNTGGTATGALTATLSGNNASEFSLSTPDTCTGMTLAGGATCMITVRMSPTLAGAKSASLAVMASPGGAAASAVSGVGQAQVTVSPPSGSGSGTITSVPAGISCPPTCTAPFATSPVTLSAVPDTGSSFTAFTGCDSMPAVNQCSLVLAQPKSVTSSFTLQSFALAVTPAGMGSGTVNSQAGLSPAISCGTTCGGNYPYNTAVTLIATANTDSSFAGWSGDCTGTGPCTVTMTAGHNVTATFDATNPVLTIARSGSGRVTSNTMINCGITCSESETPGTMIVLTAVADPGWFLGAWSGCDAVASNGTCVISAIAMSRQVDARFMTGCHPVINELVTGTNAPGNGGSDEFIELYNPCPAAFDLSGWKLGYRPANDMQPATATDTPVTCVLGMVPATGFFVCGAQSFMGARDASYNATLGAFGGALALRDPAREIVDSVCYGAPGTFCEGSPAPLPGQTAPPGTAAARSPAGTDTDNNAIDFHNAMPTPGAANP